MPQADPAHPDSTRPDAAARLLASLQGLDLTSADGRAGLRTLLAEIDRLSPDAILRQAAAIELRRVGWGQAAARSAFMGLPSRPAGPTVGAAHPEGKIA